MKSREALAAEALKYSSRHEFSEGSNSAYRAAQRRGLLDEICGQMTGLYKHKYWTEAEIHAAAKRYKTRTAFQFGAQKAYKAAYERGIVDEVCAHMPPPRTGFKRESTAVLYYRRVESIMAGTLYKIGITNHSAAFRYRDEKSSFVVLGEWEFENGKEAAKFEREIIREPPRVCRRPFGLSHAAMACPSDSA